MTFDPFLAPLARPESVTTCNGEEKFVADDGDQGKSETGIRVAGANVTAREPGPNRLTVHRSSQLIARTLSGTELKQLNLWRRNKQSRTSRLLSTANESTKAGEVSTFVDKDSVEVESHRYFKLPGTRRRRRLLWAGFRASQRRWESLEQAATLAQRNARLRQCTTSSGPLTASGLSIVEQMTNKSQPKSSPRASVSSINRQDDFRRRYGSVSLPELIDSVDMSRSVSVPYGPSETVLEPPLVARHLLRPDGSVLDHVPPVFAELDILNCEPVLGHMGVSAEDSTIGDEQCSRKTFSISTTPIPSASSRGPEVEHKAYSAATDQMNCSWLEAARWVRYEQDIDPVTGTFGQAHSPPLTFQAVVECRRYLEQGAIVLQFDHRDKLLNPINSRSRPCHDPSCLFSEMDTITHALGADCEATTNEIALIRHVLLLRHQHACDLLRVPQHHSLFPHLTEQLSGPLNHPGHTDQLTSLTSFLPNFLTRPRPKTDVRHTTISCDLQNAATQHANHKRTISVPLMDHRFSDMESGTQRTSPHPSVGSRNLSGTLARRAISAIRRAFTPTTPVCDLSTGPDPTAPSVPESILWRGRSNAGADSSHHVRISEPDYVLYQAPHETTVKPLSDLAGRLKLTTEIVSVQVGILPGLRRPMLAFIRLQRALFAYGLTELRDSHPVRFLILFFGPERRHLDYSEVGRVIATMMVDKAFRRTAYTAVSREDLMDGLRTFLDTTIVLPMLSDITPKSLLAMNDQLRLFRRHQLNAMRETKNATTVPHSGFHPPSLALFGARKRSYTRGDSKLNDVAMDPSIATIQTSVPELVITPPLMYESAAAARVKREMCRPFDHIRNVNRESSAPLLQTSSMLDFRSAEDRMNRYTPASSSGISHKSARNQRRKPSHRQRSSSTRSTPAGLFIDHSADSMGRTQNPRSRPQNYHCFACCCCCCRRHPRRFIVSGYSLGIALCTDLHAYRRRIWSDLTDPFRRQNRSDLTLMLAAIVFLYFVVLAPAVTFGALLVSNVSTAFSIPLCIFASGACQCLFALFGGQPLLIVGMTGPMLILETCIKLICDVNQAPLGIMRLLVAIYTSIFGCVAVLCNAGWLVLRVRRSLEEVFNFFVSFYFIFKSLKILFTALFHPPVILSTTNESHTLSKVQVIHNSTNLAMRPAMRPDLFNQNGSWVLSNATEMPGNFERMQYQQNQARAIGALLLAILMFTVCSSLQAIKRGRYFRRTVRNLFGYFNVPIGLLCTVLVNRFMFAELNADTVQMPPSESFCLAQLIASPFELWWSSGASNLPNPLTNATYHGLAALMAACLLPAIATDAMLSGITVAKSERRLRKPCLFSLDLVISACVMPLISGVLGWPFLSPATVRSNTHVIALTKWNTRTPPGVPHRIIGCVEQRVTGFAIGLLVALSVTLEARLFALVPMGALYGMFLYMGVMGLRDLVLVRRLCVLLKRRKHWKDREYLRHLPPFVIAIFVAVQLAFIGLLLTMNWITEFARIGATSLIFPFILLAYAITRECFLPRWALVRPHLEQMDRLHHLRLPRTRQCGFYRYGAYQSHHLSSDGNNDDDDDFGACVAGDTSTRDSQGSDERLHHRGPSAVIPTPDELKNPTVFSGIRQLDKSSARINLPWKKSAEQLKVNSCGWTVSSRLDRWSNEDDARQRSISLSACRSWQQFQRKFSDLLTHSILDADTTGRSQGEAAPFVTDEPEHLGLPREEGSPLIMHANYTTKDDGGGNDNEEDEFDLHASSSSLSNIEEYSESELEIRMDNPFWLD